MNLGRYPHFNIADQKVITHVYWDILAMNYYKANTEQ